MPEDQLAQSLGLSTWISEAEGIGGLLKVRVEDFRVEEVAKTPALDPKGRFTVARITLTDWETNRFVSRLARELSISRKRIFFSGTKDKRAVTTQLFVIDAPVHKVENVELKDVDIEVLGRSHQKLRLGDHECNRFTIVVRGCADADGSPMSGEEAVEQVDSIIVGLEARLGEARFPNWVGPQRFGSTRPVTAEVGRHVLEGDFEGAVDTYLGMPGKRETEEVSLFRECWRKQRSVEAALEVIPRQLGFERDMLNHLKRRENDWRGAFRRLPNNLQLMTIHALQSLVFNHVLVGRIERGMPLTSPLVGDLVGPLLEGGKVNVGKLSIVEEDTLERIARNCLRGRLVVTGPLPGAESVPALAKVGELERAVLVDLGLDSTDWKVSEIPRLTTRGTRRALTAQFVELTYEVAALVEGDDLGQRWKDGPRPGECWHPDGGAVRFRFSLPPGTYATTLMRELMRTPIHQH